MSRPGRPTPPPPVFFDHLNPNLPAALRNNILAEIARQESLDTTVKPIQQLFSHVPLSYAAEGMIPRFGTPHSRSRSGSSSTSRTFPTRSPNQNTARMFDRFKSGPDVKTLGNQPTNHVGRLFIKPDNGTIQERLVKRLTAHLSSHTIKQSDLDRSIVRQRVYEQDGKLPLGTTEVAIQGKALLWDGTCCSTPQHFPNFEN